jgi:subtilisin family serine protease
MSRASRPGRGTVRRIVILDSLTREVEIAASELTARCRGVTRHVYRHALRGFAIELPARELWRLERDPRVRYVVEDRVLTAFGQNLPVGISRIDGELNATASIGAEGAAVDVDIAVLDTGVAADHPDLNVHRTVSFVFGSPNVDDGNGHGTHVAGIAAARDNDSHVVGVAPGARIWSVKVLNEFGFGLGSDIIAGVDYVTSHADEIEVANMSLGGRGPSDDGNCGLTSGDVLHQAICSSVAAGVTYVVAAGNSAGQASFQVPASYDEVITVSAVVETDGLPGGLGSGTIRGIDDGLAFFSNFGADVDLAAPGVEVLSTWNDGATARRSGTSMAAPHVAGAAALYVTKHGKPTDASGVAAVRQGLIDVGYGQSTLDGFVGDRDRVPEPLLSSLGIDPLVAAAPAVLMELSSGEEFNTDYETSTPVRLCVRDESFARIGDLGSAAFKVRVDGTLTATSFAEVLPGIYEGSVELTDLGVGSHDVEVGVTDRRSAAGSARGEFATVSFEPPPDVSVELATDRLTYSAYFGTAGLVLTIRVTDELAQPIGGLDPADFEMTLIGGQLAEAVTFRETSESGVYQAPLIVTGLSDGSHRINVTVTDDRGLSETASTTYHTTDALVLGGATLALTTNRELYDIFHGQTRAVLTLRIRGDQGQPFSGVSPTLLRARVDGLEVPGLAFAETVVPGEYTASLDLEGLPSGSHQVVVSYEASPPQRYSAHAVIVTRVLTLIW